MTEVYSISLDFPDGVVEYHLKNLILTDPSILTICSNVERIGDILNIIFESPLSAGEKIVLDNLIDNYVPLPPRIDAYLYVADEVIKSDLNDATFTFLGNQPNEIHISKTSQTHYHSLKAALLARNEPNLVFIVHPGTYIEDNPLILPTGCCLLSEGNAENTFIVAQNPFEPILNVGIRCKVQGFSWIGGSKGVYFDATQSGGLGRFTAIFECYVVGCNIGIEIDGKNSLGAVDTLYMREILIVANSSSLDKGIYCHSGGQTITASVNIAGNPYFSINEGIFCENANSKASMTTSSVWFCNKAAHVDDDGEIEVQLLTCKYNGIALNVGPVGENSKINGDLFNAIGSFVYDIKIEPMNAVIGLQSGIIDILKIDNPNHVKINARFQSTQFGSHYHNILGNVVFGTKRVPAKLAIGEGTYDIDGVKIFTNSNLEEGTWVDCTAGAVSIGAPPFDIFPQITSGNCLYVGRNENPVGMKLHVNTSTINPTLKTDIIWEYWNGSSWVEFKISHTTTTSPYYSSNNSFLSNVGKYQIRFGITSATPLVAKTLNGENKKWVRAQLINDISSVPIGEYCKLHVHSKEINTNGFTEYYGDSRPIASLNSWNNIYGTLTNTVFLNDTFGINTLRFPAAAVFRGGMNTYIPKDADIGFPIKIKIAIVGNNNTSGIVHLTARYSSSNIGSAVYHTAEDAPSIPVNELSVSLNIPITEIYQEVRGTFELDVSSFLTNPANGSPDLIWLVIERNATISNLNDTYPGDVNIINIDAKYIKMYSGGHLLGY